MSAVDTRSGLPLATTTWDEKEISALHEVIESGQFSMGEKVRRYEKAFAEWVGSRYAVMVNSGSSANLLAVATAVLDDEVDLNPGDEILVTAVSWSTTYFPLIQYGLRPVFVDIDPHTLNLDVEAARRSCSERTKAVMAVNLLGNANQFDALQELCDEKQLVLIEDNCESLGATFGGRQAGTFGALGTYSSFFSHHISTMEGGMVVTDNERHQHMLISLRAHGWSRGLPQDSSVAPDRPGGFHDLFHFILPGYNLRPLEMSGAVGLHQLDKLPAILEGRRANADIFRELLEPIPGVRYQQEIGHSSWYGFSIVLHDALEGRRDEVVAALNAAGVETRPVVAGNFTRNPVMRFVDGEVREPLPHADHVHENGLFVGNHHYVVEEGLQTVADVLSSLR